VNLHQQVGVRTRVSTLHKIASFLKVVLQPRISVCPGMVRTPKFVSVGSTVYCDLETVNTQELICNCTPLANKRLLHLGNSLVHTICQLTHS